MADMLYVNGDSWTYGSELEDRRLAWPYLVGEALGLRVNNAAEPGSANDSIVRRTVRDCEDLQRQGIQVVVIIAWTHLHRFELPIGSSDGANYYNFVNPNDQDLPQIGHEIWQHWSSDRSDVERWRLQQTLLSAFLTQQNFKHYFFNTYDKINRLSGNRQGFNNGQGFDITTIELPRGEHHHPLEQGHRRIADQVLAKITGDKGNVHIHS